MEDPGEDARDDRRAHAAAAVGEAGDYCRYPSCVEPAKATGLCMKHLIAARRGDERALKIQAAAALARAGVNPADRSAAAAGEASRDHSAGREPRPEIEPGKGSTMSDGEKGKCAVPGCGKPVKLRGICWRCYQYTHKGADAARRNVIRGCMAAPKTTGRGSRGGAAEKPRAANPSAAGPQAEASGRPPCHMYGCTRPGGHTGRHNHGGATSGGSEHRIAPRKDPGAARPAGGRTLADAVAVLRADLAVLEGRIATLHDSINLLCRLDGRPEIYAVAAVAP